MKNTPKLWGCFQLYYKSFILFLTPKISKQHSYIVKFIKEKVYTYPCEHIQTRTNSWTTSVLIFSLLTSHSKSSIFSFIVLFLTLTFKFTSYMYLDLLTQTSNTYTYIHFFVYEFNLKKHSRIEMKFFQVEE